MNTTAASAQKSLTLEELNKIFKPLDPFERLRQLYQHFDVSDVLVTSSFGTKSAYLLNFISEVNPSQTVHFIDTGYHFNETLDYKTELSMRFGLNVVDLLPESTEHSLTSDEEWWVEHPRMCCAINKIAPLNRVIGNYKVWVSGLMAFQTPFRAGLKVLEEKRSILKFHPLIDVKEGQFLYDIGKLKLPEHPLVPKGFGSVGCSHCTVAGEDRLGRWAGREKDECGIHTTLNSTKQNIG